MADYYVNTVTGSDETGDGSSGNPWKTWGHAASQFQFPTECQEMYIRSSMVISCGSMYVEHN